MFRSHPRVAAFDSFRSFPDSCIAHYFIRYGSILHTVLTILIDCLVCTGERRIRVVTLALPTTSTMSEIFAGVDQIALVTFLANKAVERSLSAKLEDARDAIVNKLVEIFSVYKSTMTSAGQGASPQLVTSDTMKFLPLLLLGLLKHVCPSLSLVTTAELTCHGTGWSTSKCSDPIRSESIRPSSAHDPSISATHTVPTSFILCSTQHAKGMRHGWRRWRSHAASSTSYQRTTRTARLAFD